MKVYKPSKVNRNKMSNQFPNVLACIRMAEKLIGGLSVRYQQEYIDMVNKARRELISNLK